MVSIIRVLLLSLLAFVSLPQASAQEKADPVRPKQVETLKVWPDSTIEYKTEKPENTQTQSPRPPNSVDQKRLERQIDWAGIFRNSVWIFMALSIVGAVSWFIYSNNRCSSCRAFKTLNRTGAQRTEESPIPVTLEEWRCRKCGRTEWRRLKISGGSGYGDRFGAGDLGGRSNTGLRGRYYGGGPGGDLGDGGGDGGGGGGNGG